MPRPKRKTKIFYVLRDLSNGNGAEGIPMPTYIWAFTTRDKAVQLFTKHLQDQEIFAKLAPIQTISRRAFRHFYENVTGNYWKRKESSE